MDNKIIKLLYFVEKRTRNASRDKVRLGVRLSVEDRKSAHYSLLEWWKEKKTWQLDIKTQICTTPLIWHSFLPLLLLQSPFLPFSLQQNTLWKRKKHKKQR